MSHLKLVKLEAKYKTPLFDMMDEWCSFQTDDKDDRTPYAIFKNDYHDFDNYLANLEYKEPKEGRVPDSVFFALDVERNIFVGAVNIRHYLNDRLLLCVGHIGDGIRPSERRKGYGTEIIRLALQECKKLGINRVLMTCSKDNIGSKKTIINNGGVLENEVNDDGEIVQRYWINLKEETKDKFSLWLDKVDAKASQKGRFIKFIWQLTKFNIVGFLVMFMQLALVNLLYFIMKGWSEPLPGVLGQIFSETTMGESHSTWGYILPFFLSNIIANTFGYFLNKHKTFKSDAPWWNCLIYLVVLFLLIILATWIQGLVANLLIGVGLEVLGPTLAAMAAGFIQFLVLFPLQKYVLLREKKTR